MRKMGLRETFTMETRRKEAREGGMGRVSVHVCRRAVWSLAASASPGEALAPALPKGSGWGGPTAHSVRLWQLPDTPVLPAQVLGWHPGQIHPPPSKRSSPVPREEGDPGEGRRVVRACSVLAFLALQSWLRSGVRVKSEAGPAACRLASEGAPGY